MRSSGLVRRIEEDGVRVGDTDVGRGVFVTRDFAAGEEILTFRGTPLDFAATLVKGDRECDAFQIGPDSYLDLEPPGVFVNHSCAPNVGVRGDLVLFALRDLRSGEEIRFDYSAAMDEGSWTMPCRCGAADCRGVVRDFETLPLETKRRLIRQGVVPAFILAEELALGRLHENDLRG